MSKDKIEELIKGSFRAYRNTVIDECIAALGIAGTEAAPACLCPQQMRCIAVLRAALEKRKSREEGSE